MINSNDISVDCETFKIGFISGNRYRDGRVNLALPGKQIRYIVLEIFTFHSVKNEVYSHITVGKLRKFYIHMYLTLFGQKIRESRSFTKELISRNIFSVRE